ncbi:MAG: NAD synthetase [Cyanobacteria bacterium P01_C01_bin.120]
METMPNLDWLLGMVAIAILLGGLWMLISGVNSMND